MPAPELNGRHQKALLWTIVGRDRYAQPIVSGPTEIDVRWNDISREVLDPVGNVITIEAEVVSGIPIPVGSIMWSGGIDDLPGTASVPEQNLMLVKYYNAIPDLKARFFYHSVQLIRFRDTLPTVQ